MRIAIKGDGSDGTAALKAYLLEHDNVLAQELYEFTAPGIGQALGTPITGAFLSTAFATRIPEDDESSPLPNGNWGDAFVSAGGCTLQRWTSHPLAGTNGPNAILGGADGLYGAPGADDPTAPPRSDISTIVISCYASATPGISSGSGVNGPAAPAYGIKYSLDGGSTWTTFVSNPGSPLTRTFYSVDVTAAIAALPGGIPTFDFTQIKILVTQASSTWWDIPGPGPYPPDDHAPGAIFVVDSAGVSVSISAPAGGLVVSPTLLGRFTDASSALTYRGDVYEPAKIKNDGFKSKIGLDVDSLQLNWKFNGDEVMVADPDTDATILTMQQGFKEGLWSGVWVKWLRVYMPTFGDCDTLGAVRMFRGRMAPAQVDRLAAQITVNSVTEMFNRQIPAQLIEANNRSLQVGPGLPPDLNPDPAQWTIFQCVAGHGGTVQKIVAQQTAPTAGVVYAPGTYDLGYLIFSAAPLKNFIAQIQRYEVIAGYNVFYLFRPLYVDPHPAGRSFAAFVPVPKDQTVSGAGVVLKGFPRVPLPEQAV